MFHKQESQSLVEDGSIVVSLDREEVQQPEHVGQAGIAKRFVITAATFLDQSEHLL